MKRTLSCQLTIYIYLVLLLSNEYKHACTVEEVTSCGTSREIRYAMISRAHITHQIRVHFLGRLSFVFRLFLEPEYALFTDNTHRPTLKFEG